RAAGRPRHAADRVRPAPRRAGARDPRDDWAAGAMSTVAAPPLPGEVDAIAPRGAFEDFWRRFRRDYVAMGALCFIVFVILGATVGAPLVAWVTGHPPDRQYVNGLTIDGIPLGPFSHEVGPDGLTPNPHGQFFIFGTDKLGRDVLVRLLYGARISLLVAFAA